MGVPRLSSTRGSGCSRDRPDSRVPVGDGFASRAAWHLLW